MPIEEGRYPKEDGEYFYASELNGLMVNSFADIKTYKLAVTTNSASLDLSSIDYKYAILIRNSSQTDCYIDLDDTATTDGFYLPSGAEIILKSVSFDNISAITSAGSATLSVAVYTGVNNKTGYATNKEILKLSATANSSSVSFTNTTDYKDIIIINEGVNDVYISFSDTATTDDFKLNGGDYISVNTNKYQIAGICDTGKTSTVKVLGVY